MRISQHPADIRAKCERCKQTYYLSDGCSCDDFSDEELEKIENYNEFVKEMILEKQKVL